MTAAGVPPAGASRASSAAAAAAHFDFSQLTGVGDLGAAILAAVPGAVPGDVAPVIAQIVEGIHGAFSLATAQTFWLGVVGSIVAVVAARRDQGDPAPDVERRSRSTARRRPAASGRRRRAGNRVRERPRLAKPGCQPAADHVD